MKQNVVQQPIIYQAKNGAIELRGDVAHETIWATLDQIAALFGRDKSVISRHIKNIFAENELDKGSVVAKNATTAKDGKTYQVEYYNLDIVISVGYRVNSKTATQFRIWASNILKSYITNGYSINRKRIAKNYDAFMKSVADIQALLPSTTEIDSKKVIDLIKEFAHTWFSLDAYDRGVFTGVGVTKKTLAVTSGDLLCGIELLKKELIRKGEAVTCLP